MKKRLLALVMAAAMILALAGCGGSEEKTPEDAEATEGPDQIAEEQIDWEPSGKVTMVIAYEAGSIQDITARVLLQFLSGYLGQPVEVENIPGSITEKNEAGEPVEVGGAGSLGWSELAAREPDGLTIGYIDLPTFPQSLLQQSGYYNAMDLTPICNHVSDTAVVVVRENDQRFQKLDDLVEYAQEHAGELVTATAGERSNTHAWTEAFADSASFTYQPNHLGSGADAVQSVLAGKSDFCVAKAGDLYGRSLGLQVLGVFASERLEEYPDAPTLGELGYYDKWQGTACCVVAPAGTPAEAVAYYERAFREAMSDPRYLNASSGVTTDYWDAATVRTVIAQQRAFALSRNRNLW